QRDAHQPVDRSEDEEEARTFRISKQTAEPEDDPALVLGKDLDGAENVNRQDDDDDKGGDAHGCYSSFLPRRFLNFGSGSGCDSRMYSAMGAGTLRCSGSTVLNVIPPSNFQSCFG